MPQLYREQVERQITEMWAALADVPRDESYAEAFRQAVEAEHCLREQLAHDERVREAAPALLKALQRSLSWLSSYPGGGAMGAYDEARAAIAKATGGQ